jgi:hypothetical protein
MANLFPAKSESMSQISRKDHSADVTILCALCDKVDGVGESRNSGGVYIFDNLDRFPLGLEQISSVQGQGVTHLKYRVVK